jgi:hypothetical protein
MPALHGSAAQPLWPRARQPPGEPPDRARFPRTLSADFTFLMDLRASGHTAYAANQRLAVSRPAGTILA